jgi:rhodanese-related sulfurtransferase
LGIVAMITPLDAKTMIEKENAFILDVRSYEEFAEGHLYGATCIPLGELQARCNELSMNKENDILVYCHAGSRSAMACQLLKSMGYAKVHNLQGGIIMWTGAGLQVVK